MLEELNVFLVGLDDLGRAVILKKCDFSHRRKKLINVSRIIEMDQKNTVFIFTWRSFLHNSKPETIVLHKKRRNFTRG